MRKLSTVIAFLILSFALLPARANAQGSAENHLRSILNAVFSKGSFKVDIQAEFKNPQSGSAGAKNFDIAMALDWRKSAKPVMNFHTVHQMPQGQMTMDVLQKQGTLYMTMSQGGPGGSRKFAYKMDPKKWAQQGSKTPLPGQSEALNAFPSKGAKESPQEAMMRQVKSQGKLVFIKPNVLKILKTKGKRGSTKIYFDQASHLPQTMMVKNPDGLNTLRFSNWKRGVSVDSSLPLPAEQYQSFSPASFSSAFTPSGSLGTGSMGVGAMGGANPPSTSGGASPMFPGGFQQGGENMQERMEAMRKAQEQMRKQFQSPEFQEKMQKAREMQKKMMQQFKSPEFQKKMRELQKMQGN